MRSPTGAFDLRAALTAEVQAALEDLNARNAEDCIHACRVRLKRARAIARLCGVGAPGLAGVFDDTARGVMRTLAAARSARALGQTARRLAKKSHGKEARAFEAMAQAFHATTPTPLDVEAAYAGLKDLIALAQVWPEPSARQIRRGARRISGKARRAFRRAYAGEDAALRHDWRKREKDRLYAAEALGRAWPGRRRRKIAEALNEALGRERDARLLLQYMNIAPVLANEERGSERAARTLSKRCKRLAREADKLGVELHRRRD